MSETSHDSETPAHGQQVITAVAFIHATFEGQHKVFLPKRSNVKKFLPNQFELPGGHIDFTEDIVEGLKREIIEELNMRISVGDVINVFTYSNEIKGSHSVEVGYLAVFTDDINRIELHTEDHSEYRWLTFNEVEEIFNQKLISTEEFTTVRKGFAALNGEGLNLS